MKLLNYPREDDSPTKVLDAVVNIVDQRAQALQLNTTHSLILLHTLHETKTRNILNV